MKIATWNVNSIRARLPNLLRWLESAAPDILLLQEIKTVEETFPRLEIEAAGYQVAVAGQKAWNGVAILSRTPLEVCATALPGDPSDEQARYLEARTETPAGPVRVATIYLPNGNPVDSEKFPYKLAWFDRLQAHAESLLASEETIVLGGDFNVIPGEDDCYDPAAWEGDALYRPETRAAFRRLAWSGYTDAFRALHAGPGSWSFWDYTGGAWQKDHGIRIDFLMLSPRAADLLAEAGIDRQPRGEEKASDHTPVWCTLEAAPGVA